MKYALYLGIVAIFVLSSSTLADVISYEELIPSTNVGSVPAIYYLPQFDPSQGTLISVELKLDVTYSGGVIKWDNEAGVPSSVTLGVGTEVTATGPGALALVATPLQKETGSVTADEPNDGTGDFAGDDSFTVSIESASDSDTDSPTSFADYIGTGNISIDVTSITETYCTTIGGYGPQNTCNLGAFTGKVTVTYTYVPEPAAMSVVAMGGVALLIRRRRRRA